MALPIEPSVESLSIRSRVEQTEPAWRLPAIPAEECLKRLNERRESKHHAAAAPHRFEFLYSALIPPASKTQGRFEMALSQVTVERLSLVSSRPFAQVVASIEAGIGHPDMRTFGKNVAAAKNWQELEQVVLCAVGPSGFMEFARFNLGQIIAKERGAAAPGILRFVVGNPLIMKQMVEHVPDAGSYAPVTILIDERADGVHLTYDLMASYLAAYGNSAALQVARELDSKVQGLLEAAAH
jgi:uncharacterized protein (DUF302 family)